MKRARCWLGRVLVPLTLAPLGLTAGCARPEPMTAASGRTPTGDGTVMTENGEYGNTVVHVRVKHMVPSYSLASDALAYVVWVQPQGAPIQNVGPLNVNEDRVGQIDFVTPLRVFRVSITPESSTTRRTPQNRPVFDASVNTGE